MKHISFSYKIIANFILTREELDHLIAVSTIHYDGKCQDASKQGGFIYGWKNRLEFSKQDEIEVNATIQELDTCTKILEIENKFNGPITLQRHFNSEAQWACQESEEKNNNESRQILI